MNPTAKTRNNLRYRLNVESGSPEVNYEKTQSVLSGDHSIRDERLRALFCGFRQAPIQFVQIFLRLFRPALREVSQENKAALDAEVVIASGCSPPPPMTSPC